MRLGLGLGFGLELPLPGQRAAHRSPKRAVRSVSAAEAAAGLTWSGPGTRVSIRDTVLFKNRTLTLTKTAGLTLRRSSVLAQEPG